MNFRKSIVGFLNKRAIPLSDLPDAGSDHLEIVYAADVWYHSKKLTEQDGALRLAEGAAYSYLSYQEPNLAFGLRPSSNILQISDDYIYRFIFHCDGVCLQGAKLCIIAYDNAHKLYVVYADANQPADFTFPSMVETIRVAVKISAPCELRDTFRIQIDKEPKPHLKPVSAHRKRRRLQSLNIACVLDEFTYSSLNREANLVPITPSNYHTVLSQNNIDFLLVESAWRGSAGAFRRKIATNNPNMLEELREITGAFKAYGIPTVFWSKEDPVHFEHFIGSARFFDTVFTTDSDMLDRYREALGHDRVYCLPFAASAAIHNPVCNLTGRADRVCFSGTFYQNRYPERGADSLRLLRLAAPFGLDIFDRNLGESDPGLRFPEELAGHVRGTLSGRRIDIANKGYRVGINVTTVKDSPTMFARRVYELLACGTPVLSNYSVGIERRFGGIVCTSDDDETCRAFLEKMFTDEHAYRKTQLLGIRSVLSQDTYADRLTTICEKIGIRIKRRQPRVLVLSRAASAREFEHVTRMFNRQSWPHKLLRVLCDTGKKRGDETTLAAPDELPESGYDFIAYFSPQDTYTHNYLTDLCIAAGYATHDVIGKACYYALRDAKPALQGGGWDFSVAPWVHPHAMMLRAASVRLLSPETLWALFEQPEGNRPLLDRLTKFSADRFGYIENCRNDSFRSTVDV